MNKMRRLMASVLLFALLAQPVTSYAESEDTPVTAEEQKEEEKENEETEEAVDPEDQTEEETDEPEEETDEPEETEEEPEEAVRDDFHKGVLRIQGATREKTAIEVSKELTDKADTVLVAGSGNFADALSASSLTKGKYPLLLLGDETEDVYARIEELGAKKIYVLSGTSHISDATLEEMEELDGVETVERLAGKDRYETNEEILDLADQANLIVASGENFPDALAAGALTESLDAKLVLTGKSSLPDAVKDEFKDFEGNVFIIGGNGTVKESTENEIKALAKDANIQRIEGKTRYETAIALSKFAGEDEAFILVDGTNFPDALAASSVAVKYDLPILLTTPKELEPATRDLIFSKMYHSAMIIGGKASVSAEIETLIQKAQLPDTAEYADLTGRDIYRYSEAEEVLYTEPSADSEAVKTMRARNITKVLGVQNGWLKLDDYGTTGWAKADAFKFYTPKTFGKVEFDVPYFSQVDAGAPWGCVPSSLYIGMQYKGYIKDTTLRQFIDNMPYHESDPSQGFSGSPITGSDTYKIHINAEPLAEYARTYNENVVALKDATMDDVIREIQNYNPVVLNLTLTWADPIFKEYPVNGKPVRMVKNNHASLFNGYDPETEIFTTTDPYNRPKNVYGNTRGVPGQKLVFYLPYERVAELFQYDNFAISVR